VPRNGRRGVRVLHIVDPDSTKSRLLGGRGFEQPEWDYLVELHGQEVWDVARQHGLSPAQAADVSQLVWLGLADHLAAVSWATVRDWLMDAAHREAQRAAATAALVAVRESCRGLLRVVRDATDGCTSCGQPVSRTTIAVRPWIAMARCTACGWRAWTVDATDVTFGEVLGLIHA